MSRQNEEPGTATHIESIAVSLKRIADVMEAQHEMYTKPVNQYGENFVENIGRVISDGIINGFSSVSLRTR